MSTNKKNHLENTDHLESTDAADQAVELEDTEGHRHRHVRAVPDDDEDTEGHRRVLR